jgi:aminotransferase in exopolysaccharide biosynthesis
MKSPPNLLAESILKAIRDVTGEGVVALHEPTFCGNEWKYLKECLDSTFVSSVGKFVDRFEVELARYTGARFAVALVNGTAALHIALKLAGVVNDDEVLLPSLTFIATANAVRYCNATPHFVDSERVTLGIDTARLREYLLASTFQSGGNCVNSKTGKIIRVLLPMHTFGHPSDIDGLLSIARDFNLVLVEDAAESLGSYYHGQHTGTFGLIGTLSFNGNKTITTGGGGAIITNDEGLARHAKHLTTTAKVSHTWEYRHDELGYNYRMPNLNAALGCAQLEQLSELLRLKRDLYRRYAAVMDTLPGVELVKEPENCQSNYWLQAIMLDDTFALQRDSVLSVTNTHGVMTRPAWILLHQLPMYADCPRMNMPVAESISGRLINIPSSPSLSMVNHAY